MTDKINIRKLEANLCESADLRLAGSKQTLKSQLRLLTEAQDRLIPKLKGGEIKVYFF